MSSSRPRYATRPPSAADAASPRLPITSSRVATGLLFVAGARPNVQPIVALWAGPRSATPSLLRSVAAGVFVNALAIGAAVTALWVDVRMSDSRPQSLGRRLAHAFLAFVALNLASAVVVRFAQPDAGTLQRAGAILFVFLPGLLYAFLAGIWLLRSLAEIGRLARH